MYLNFDKESLYFLTDEKYPESLNEEIDYKKLLKCKNLSIFCNLFQTIIYYIDLTRCNNIVLVEYDGSIIERLKSFFPKINVYTDYEKDLQDLSSNNLNYAIFFNNTFEDLKFCKLIVEKYEPYLASINYYIDNNLNSYLDGLLLRNYFTENAIANLIVRGVGTKRWQTGYLYERWKCFQCCRKNNTYMNPLTNDNTTIYKEKGLYNGMDETYLTILAIDYLKKINVNITYNNTITLLEKILNGVDLNMVRLLN